MRETTMHTPRSVKMEEREEVRRSRDSLQPAVRQQAVPLQPMEVNSGAEIPPQPVEDPTPEQVAGPGEGHDSVGEPMLEQFVEDCSPWKGLELEKLMEG